MHELCRVGYGPFFASSHIDEAFQITKATCAAGLLSVAALCSQSIALTNSSWSFTERPVREEGRAVKDILEPMPAESCLRLCEAHADACAGDPARAFELVQGLRLGGAWPFRMSSQG